MTDLGELYLHYGDYKVGDLITSCFESNRGEKGKVIRVDIGKNEFAIVTVEFKNNYTCRFSFRSSLERTNERVVYT